MCGKMFDCIFLYKGPSLLLCVSYTERPSPVVFQLFQREDVLVEILLEFLVGVVDVKLLEPVYLQKVFELLNIVHTNRF